MGNSCSWVEAGELQTPLPPKGPLTWYTAESLAMIIIVRINSQPMFNQMAIQAYKLHEEQVIKLLSYQNAIV